MQAFQRDSPIAIDVSRAILKLSEDGTLKLLEDKWFAPSPDCSANVTDTRTDSLSINNFWGLYLISGATSTVCFLLFLTHSLRKYCRNQEAYVGNLSPVDESVWIDLIGKLRSIKHYLLLDQVSLLNILWTWDENQSLFIYNMVLCGYLFQHAKCKHLVTVFSGVLLTSFYRKCNSLVSAKFLMALMQGLLLFIIPTKLHLVGCTWFVSMKDILHPILTFKD